MHRALALAALLGLSASVAACCRDKICRTDDAVEATACCGDRKPEENNCNACSSQPSCGWCEEPVSGAPPCQARPKSGAMPSTCKSGFRFSPDQCAAPKPPPGALT